MYLERMKVPLVISRRIEDEIASLTPEPVGHINFEALKYHALPLIGTIGEVWLLRADGSLWRADSDAGLTLEPLPESLHTFALVAGMERYEWLVGLLPLRPTNAVDCTVCQRRGRLGPDNARFCPACNGLGWRPVDEASNEP
jgi:hypothetical protein